MKKILTNNFIRAKEIRVIDEHSQQLGIMNIFDAIDLAKSKGLDLIQVTEKADPPVCKIADYGKYLYSVKKKEGKIKAKTHQSELKEIRLSFNISPHDIETKSRQAEKFLKEGHKVKISMILRGREKSAAMRDFARKKAGLFLETIAKLAEIKTERELKKEPRGFTMIISRK